MKSYKERTQAVLEKVDELNKTDGYTVENGGQTLAVRRRKNIIIWSAFAAACLAIILAFNLVLFLPYSVPEISAYKDSEYYGLISVVNGIANRSPYHNNFDKWTSEIDWSWAGGLKGGTSAPGINFGDAVPEAPTAPGIDYPMSDASGTSTPNGSAGNGDYHETTNNQVKAVTEADLLKRSTKYAFYLSIDPALYRGGIELLTYKLNGKDTLLTSSHKIETEGGTAFYCDTCEGYLSADCNTVTVISNCYDKDLKQMYTCVINLDVSDPANVKESGRIYVSGSYISSRMTNGSLLLFTNYNVKNNPDFSDEEDFVPRTGSLKNLKSLPMEDIVYSEDATQARYTVTCAIDGKSLEINSHYAFLSFSQNVYVSESNIYLTRTCTDREWEKNVTYGNYTNINCVSYADGELKLSGTADVPGFVLNQYSMDEYDGVLRVVTEYHKTYKENGKYEDYSGAGLFCIDIKSFDLRATFEDFCPDGESVYSVRFDGTTAYVCTALVKFINTDPVFAIDLSDLDNITSKDTGTITGYSLSLMKFKGDTLLGIGYGESRSDLKIELYEETQDGVQSVAVFEKENCSFSADFKAYFIDAESGLIGLSVYYYDYENHERIYEYIVLLYDGYNLTQVESVRYENSVNRNYSRAFLADGYIYIFADTNVDVIDWNAATVCPPPPDYTV